MFVDTSKVKLKEPRSGSMFLEDHSFKEPSSWTDEYKRIFKLFEENLK